jgi:hypothetical protein
MHHTLKEKQLFLLEQIMKAQLTKLIVLPQMMNPQTIALLKGPSVLQ